MKEGQIELTNPPVTQAELEQINRFSRKELAPEEIYTFAVTLCDNEVDRDGEQFSLTALEEMERLFIGKTGIFDHSMRGRDQKARIYSTRLETKGEQSTQPGQPYSRLTAKAYMLRTAENEDLIAEIEGGIKKEVSVGVSVESRSCSVCGAQQCTHQRGQRYKGQLCYQILDGVQDAYEWSFVAVPAQPKAGVTKAYSGTAPQTLPQQEGWLTELTKSAGAVTLTANQREQLTGRLCRLEKEAEIGRSCKQALVNRVTWLQPIAMPEMDAGVFAGAVQEMGMAELKGFEKAFEAKKAAILPCAPQLAAGKGEISPADNVFKI